MAEKRFSFTTMIKRSVFSSRTLPYLLILPQIVVTATFFYWPAAQGLFQSLMLSDPFGLHNTFVWFDNFITLFKDPLYLKSVAITLIFSACTAFIPRKQSIRLPLPSMVPNGYTSFLRMLFYYH